MHIFHKERWPDRYRYFEENVILERFKFCSKLIGVKLVTKRDNENWQHKHDPGIVFANSPEIISFIEDWLLHCIEFLWKNFKLAARPRTNVGETSAPRNTEIALLTASGGCRLFGMAQTLLFDASVHNRVTIL